MISILPLDPRTLNWRFLARGWQNLKSKSRTIPPLGLPCFRRLQYDIYANHWNKNQRERKVAGGPIMLTPEMFRQRRRNELADCAEQVYTYFNKKVFQSKLPDLDNVVITWSNKLTSTAGQSRFIRDPETKTKVVAQILLSVKILDSVVKVRLTMAHEMCHLATWLLDNRLQESHGELFWKWARRINKLDSDTEITQYHDYEINFLYTWICLNLNCGHIMGRWRDSIDINTARCNKCKTGKLRVMSTPHIDDHRVVDRNMSSKQARQPKPKAKKTQSTPLSPSTPTKTAPKSQSTPVLNEIRQKEYARESESDSDEEDSNLGIVPAGRKWLVVDDDSDKDQNPQHKSVDELAKMFGGIIITTKSCGDGPSAGKRHKKKNAKAKQTL
ncbi:SprT-like family-domain-containing protein [Mycena amicta]|nr:SprT-like family-domain-containing protein [Mycena amicta]